ncbi:MAG: M18 family aminopeptidase [Myxococcaceae bacterium]
MGIDLADDLLAFVDASPTPWHAVAEASRRLEAEGYRRLDERDAWSINPGDKLYVTRAGSSVAAFHVGSDPIDRAGFRLVGSHTDSPNLRLKPNAAYTKAGHHQLGVEVYGGALWHTWLDRDLSIAGRVVVSVSGNDKVETRLVDYGRKALCRIPNLAIHLNRGVNNDGLKLNAQEHLAPVLGLESTGPLELKAWIAELASVKTEQILASDLCLYDVQPSARAGLKSEYLLAPRLDNLASCHSSLTALLNKGDRKSTCGVVLYDHEEVGSTSAQGAAGPFLRDILERLVLARAGSRANLLRAYANSLFISSDMAHAVHPNYADKHEPHHKPLFGAGPVVKSNVNQSYATDAETWGLFAALCREVDVTPQAFVVRSDLPCGSTIGPITAGELGIRTIDIGNPMLSMHSVREMAAAADVERMVAVLRRFFR